jgi:FdhD protein
VPLYRFNQGKLVSRKDAIAVEADLVIRIRNHPDMRLSRTPGDDLNLVMGHLFCSGVLDAPEDVAKVEFSYQGTARADVSLGGSRALRRILPRRPAVRLAPHRLFGLKEVFEHRQNLFKHTGSTHAAALFSLHGELLSYGEDVGRHNAFDKAVGRALQEGTLGQVAIAMLSSRIAVDLASKAAIANIPVLCGFSAATSSGVEYAEKNGITLVGRLKEESFDVYANAWRIQA